MEKMVYKIPTWSFGALSFDPYDADGAPLG